MQNTNNNQAPQGSLLLSLINALLIGACAIFIFTVIGSAA